MCFASPNNAPYRIDLMPQACLYAREHVHCFLLGDKLDRAHNSGQQRRIASFMTTPNEEAWKSGTKRKLDPIKPGWSSITYQDLTTAYSCRAHHFSELIRMEANYSNYFFLLLFFQSSPKHNNQDLH